MRHPLLSVRQFKLIKQMIELQVVVQEAILFPEMIDADKFGDVTLQLGPENIYVGATDHLGVPHSENLSHEEFFDQYTFYDN